MAALLLKTRCITLTCVRRVQRAVSLDVQWVRCALLKTSQAREWPLAPQRIGEDSERGFDNHLPWFAGAQRSSHRAFEATEETFHCPASSGSGLLQVIGRHLRPPFAAQSSVRSP